MKSELNFRYVAAVIIQITIVPASTLTLVLAKAIPLAVKIIYNVFSIGYIAMNEQEDRKGQLIDRSSLTSHNGR